jgi:4'-phosphopantetheinyl transferase
MIHWLVQAAADNDEIEEGQAPAGLLSASEAATLAELRVRKRRRDWLVGRWTAKQLLQRTLAAEDWTLLPQQIVIDNDPDGAPFASLMEQDRVARLPWSLSISHSHGLAFCAVHPAEEEGIHYAIGADLEFIEAREDNFVRDYFTPDEMALAAQASPRAQAAVVTAVWSAKEAVLKALRTGLRLDTRSIQCLMPVGLPAGDEWHTFSISVPDDLAPGASWTGWWRRPLQHPDFIMTLAIKAETVK